MTLFTGVQLLWVTNYWDCPLEGLCCVNGIRHWFKIDNPFEDEAGPNKYYLISLTDDELKEIDKRHELFQNYVGTHWDYTDNKRGGVVRPESEWHKFYDIYPSRNKLRFDKQPIGCFKWPER